MVEALRLYAKVEQPDSPLWIICSGRSLLLALHQRPECFGNSALLEQFQLRLLHCDCVLRLLSSRVVYVSMVSEICFGFSLSQPGQRLAKLFDSHVFAVYMRSVIFPRAVNYSIWLLGIVNLLGSVVLNVVDRLAIRSSSLLDVDNVPIRFICDDSSRVQTRRRRQCRLRNYRKLGAR